MVNYGKALVQAQRIGWESAYLDYQKLKLVLRDIEAALTERHNLSLMNVLPLVAEEEEEEEAANGTIASHDVETLQARFFTELRLEIEKMSLFILKQQGNLADAVGVLRFDPSDQFDSKNALFQSATTSKLDRYSVLGVELLHLLRFICINSIGIRKILKKYSKIFEKLDEPHFYSITGEHLEQLANSQSVKAIQASLQAALEESYQDTITFSSQEDFLAFYKFQCVMECSYTLCQNAELLQQPFTDFLSRKSMIVTGADLGGMDGTAGKAFQWLLKLHPDDLLAMSQPQLEHLWNRWAVIPTDKTSTPQNRVHKKGLPMLPRRPLPSMTEEQFEKMDLVEAEDCGTKTRRIWGGVNASSMTLNLLSTLLYTINYYIIAPTANHYAIKLGTDGAFGATLIGASSFSAIFAAFCYSLWYTRSTFKSALIFSALCPLVGNLIYALAISYNSMTMGLWGRILCGFGSAEVVNRQLISTCVSFEGMTKASALFVAAGASGMSIGPLIAGVLDIVSGRDTKVDLELPFTPAGGIIWSNVTSPGFVMAALWFLQLLGLMLLFQEPVRINTNTMSEDGSTDYEVDDGDRAFIEIEETTQLESKKLYGSIKSITSSFSSAGDFDSLRHSSYHGVRQELVLTCRLIMQNPGLPVTLLIFAYIELADEVLISSCSMVVRRYFGWHGAVAGFLIASLGALVLPAHFVVEKASHHYSERRILVRSIWAIMVCLICILNFSGMYYDIVGSVTEPEADLDEVKDKDVKIVGEKLDHLLTKDREFEYDWGVGQYVYIIFLSTVFMGTIVLEGVDTSIMAKVTPARLNDMFINSGLLATLIGTLGRVLADGTITMSALLDIHVYVDFVNATFLPILLLALVGLYLANRNYESLV